MEDSYRHKGLRRRLIEELKGQGITDEAVLQAMDKIPRHFFMDSAFAELAYQNRAFPIGVGQTISQPYTVAFQTQLLELSPGQKVLEIGTGSGYQTAVLCEMGARVYTVERHRSLSQTARKVLGVLKYRPYFTYGDGFKGLKGFAPYDKVLVTCGAPYLPEKLVEQIGVGGSIVIPIDTDVADVQEMHRFVKKEDGSLDDERHGKFRFVPMLEKRAGNHLSGIN